MARLAPLIAAALVLLLGSASTAHAAALGTVTSRTYVIGAGRGNAAHGTATFSYDSTTDTTSVTLRLVRLAPNSRHPAFIYSGGSCADNGPVAYIFHASRASGTRAASADAHGMLTAFTSFRGPVAGRNLYLRVHRGPHMVGAQSRSIACGVV